MDFLIQKKLQWNSRTWHELLLQKLLSFNFKWLQLEL